MQVEQSSNANVVTEMAAVTPEGNNINISAVKDQSGVITPSMYVRQMENALEAQTGENVSYDLRSAPWPAWSLKRWIFAVR